MGRRYYHADCTTISYPTYTCNMERVASSFALRLRLCVKPGSEDIRTLFGLSYDVRYWLACDVGGDADPAWCYIIKSLRRNHARECELFPLMRVGVLVLVFTLYMAGASFQEHSLKDSKMKKSLLLQTRAANFASMTQHPLANFDWTG